MNDELQSRVERLERAQARLTRAAAAVLVALAAGVLMAQAPPPVPFARGPIEATSYVLVDEHGTVRAMLRLERGVPVLEMRDDEGAFLRLTARDRAGTVEYRSETGKQLNLMKPAPDVKLLR